MDSSQLIQQGREAIQAGNKPKARQLLQQAVQQQPQNYAGWLWLASVAASPAASLEYVKRAEQLQPNDPTVQKAKAWAERRLAAKTASKTPPLAQTTLPASTTSRQWSTWRLVGGLALLLLLIGAAGFFIFRGWGTAETASQSPPVVVAAVSEADSAANIAAAVAETDEPIAAVEVEPEIQVEPTEEPVLVVPAIDVTPEPTERPERMLAKNAGEQNEPRAKWTATPLPTNTPVPTPTIAPTFVAETTAWVGKRPFGVGVNERWIDINLTSQTLSAFEGDTLVFTSIVSSGTYAHPTVTGQFRTWHKVASQTMDGSRLGYDYYLENVPYVMYFYEDYAIHGAYWHNNFGTPMSHGCVNMSIADSEWLFNWASLGTLVNVHY